jgi:aspartyl-tRNA(Asn)/glutamyl-tRNA(Gln) amidotransferase subunit A
VSRWGVTSYADSLDCVGVLARDMGTVSSAFGKRSNSYNSAFELNFSIDVISGYDSKDSTAARPNARKAAKKASEGIMTKLKGPLNGLRLGIPQVESAL